jgi:hypothetical protein
MRRSLREQGNVRCNVRGPLDLGMRGERADMDLVSCDLDAFQLRDTADVDQYVRRGQPQIERRKQALASREQLRPVPVLVSSPNASSSVRALT